MKQHNHQDYSDHQIVDGILSGERDIIEYFFYKKCSGLLRYIVLSIFDGDVQLDDLVSELYLFISKNDWQVIKQFEFRSSLITYISVVSIRYFQKRRDALIDSSHANPHNNIATLTYSQENSIESHIDIRSALRQMRNERYRLVIEALDLMDMRPEDYAKQIHVTVDNLYNIHRRALLQLRSILENK